MLHEKNYYLKKDLDNKSNTILHKIQISHEFNILRNNIRTYNIL